MELWAEQHVEGLAGLRLHRVGAIDLVDVDALEERLIGDAAQRVIEAHVDRVGVARECQAVFQVGFGLVVLDLPGVDAGAEERESSGYPVLFLFEQVQGYGSGVVGVEETAALVAELVALCAEGAAFDLAGGVQVIELAGEHVP